MFERALHIEIESHPVSHLRQMTEALVVDSGTDLNNTEGGDSLEKYDLAIEELEAKIAPIGISQGGQRWGGFGGG